MTFAELQDGISKALDAGDVLAPEALLRTLEGQADTNRSLMDIDQRRVIFESLHEEFPFFRALLPNQPALLEEEAFRGIGVLRWLIEQFRGWSAMGDPNLKRLAALIVIIQSCPWESSAWFLLDHSVLFNAELVQRLKNVIANVRPETRVMDPRGDAVAADTTLAQIHDAESTADWKALLQIRRRTGYYAQQNSIITEAVRYLYRHDQAALVAGTAETRSLAFAPQVLNALTVEQSFNLAGQSDNQLIQLMAIETTFDNRPRNQAFTASEEVNLSALLERTALDQQAWQTLLQLYSEHPSAYPSLQPVIGAVLIAAPEVALDAYVDCVKLSAPCNMQDRHLVAICLEIFRKSSGQERRQRLWKRAFERWKNWSFDAAGQSLMDPTVSELDYAVVGYLKECDETGLAAIELQRIETELISLETRWFATSVDLYIERNRLMSRLQPYAHAVNPSSDQGWLTANTSYRPAVSATLYASLRYSIKGDS
jgi:hypothetical protein